MAKNLDSQINVKMSKELLASLREIENRHGLSPADSLRRLADAMAEFYREHGWFGFPVKIEPAEPWLKTAVEEAASKRKPRHDRGSKSA